MKNNIRLKGLICISLLLFLLPFLQTCSDKRLKNSPDYKVRFNSYIINTEKTREEVVLDTTKIKETEKEKKAKEIWLEKAQKDNTVNAYFLGFAGYSNFKIKDLNDKQFYVLSIFTIIIILTIVMLVLSFRKKVKQIIILSSINLILLAIATISLCLIEVVEDFKQIKYGYYLFIVNSIVIIIESRKELNRKTLEKTD